MKHCHFSILYNELPFLKVKLPFLYEHFQQLIFFDLNITDDTISDDGSHEFIASYPDPENKITLIENVNLKEIIEYCGESFVKKQKMFAVGSQHVRDNMDVFWCTDMDEFFDKKMIKDVEEALSDSQIQSVNIDHIIFIKDTDHYFVEQNKNNIPFYCRVARHKKGNLYGHCSLGTQFLPSATITNNYIRHYAYIGNKRVLHKLFLYSQKDRSLRRNYINYVNNVWFGNKKLTHPSPYTNWKVKFDNTVTHPSYIDCNALCNELDNVEYNDKWFKPSK